MPSVGSILHWLLRYVTPNLVFFAVTFGALAWLNKLFAFELSYRTIGIIALALNPATLGALVVVVLLMRWDRAALKLLFAHPGPSGTSAIRAGHCANEKLIARIEECLSRWSPLKAGIFLGFACNSFLLLRKQKSHQVNATNSVDSDVVHARVSAYLMFQYRLCAFVTSLASYPDNAQSKKRLEECLNEWPGRAPSSRLPKSVKETYEDGAGFMSTMNLLLRMSLCLTLPTALRESIIEVFEASIGDPARAGWLGNRLFEYTQTSLIYGAPPTQIKKEIRRHISALAAVAAGAGPEEVHAMKWKIRGALHEELLHIQVH